VKAYTPWEVPHWAYAGSSRRYFDFGVNGKIAPWGAERNLHHYGSGINSVPLLAYRLFPNDSIALRAGFAASLGALASIDPATGAPSMGFHGDPSLLVREPYSADHGVGLATAAAGWGCYLHQDEELGYIVGYGCDAANTSAAAGSAVAVNATLRDAYRQSVYVGPLGLWLRSRNAPIGSVEWAADGLDAGSTGTLTVRLDAPPPSNAAAAGGAKGAKACRGPYSAVRLVIATPAALPSMRVSSWAWADPAVAPPLVRGAFELPCDALSASIKYTR
jgi:hypothetical protein